MFAIASSVLYAAPAVDRPGSLQLGVVAPDEQHHAWMAARRLADLAKAEDMPIVVAAAPNVAGDDGLPDFLLMPVRSLATQVPELQVLELPFFYPELGAVHRALDGDLGVALKEASQAKGWIIVGFWDEGLHVMSGLRNYDHAVRLTGMEFILTRPDPIAQRQFSRWKAFTRFVNPQEKGRILQECLVASRAATLQELWREEMHRVHLSLALTYHRYEGWVVVAQQGRWYRWPEQMRNKLLSLVSRVTTWQRREAQTREAAAIAMLQDAGMRVYELDGKKRQAFKAALPAWIEFLPAELDKKTWDQLITRASFGTTSVIGSTGETKLESAHQSSQSTPNR